MKKILLATAMVISVLSAFAQKDPFDNVRKFYLLQKFEDSKKEIDKNLLDPKFQAMPESYLWKANIYAELYGSDKTRAMYPGAGFEAYKAFEKYRQLDPATKGLKENGYRFISLIYSTAFNTGREFFAKSQWDSAFNYFVLAETVGDYITSNGLSSSKQSIDTFTVLYTGYSAQNSKRTNDAVKYYTKFADQKIGGKDYVDLYRYLVSVYTDSKDEANFKKYLTIAKQVYPNEAALWTDYEFDYLSKNVKLADLLEMYKTADQGGKLTADEYSGYGQAFANLNKDDLAKLDSVKQADLHRTASEAFQKAFNQNKNGVDAFNAAIMYYNEWGVLDERFAAFRGTTADLKAKRDAVEKQQQTVADQAIVWLENSYNALKNKTTRDRIDKTCLSKSVDYLTNIYQWKRDKARGKNPKDFDLFDAKFKQYDAEHGKYQ
jgi:hypothetical protein